MKPVSVMVQRSPEHELTASLARVFDLSGMWDAGVEYLADQRNIVTATRERARLLALEVGLRNARAFARGQLDAELAAALETFRGLAQEIGDPAILADAHFHRALHLHIQYFHTGGDPDEELRLFSEALRLATSTGDLHRAGMAAFYVGTFHHVIRHDLDRALLHFEASRLLAERAGDSQVLSYNLRHIGQIYQERRDYELAAQCLHDAMAYRLALGWVPGVAYQSHALGMYYREVRNKAAAEHYIRVSRRIAEQLGMDFLRTVIDSEDVLLTGGERLAAER